MSYHSNQTNILLKTISWSYLILIYHACNVVGFAKYIVLSVKKKKTACWGRGQIKQILDWCTCSGISTVENDLAGTV